MLTTSTQTSALRTLIAAASATAALFLATPAFSGEVSQAVIQITTDADKTLVSDLYAVMNENGELTKVRMQNNRNEVFEATVEEIRTGATLLEMEKRAIAILKAGDFDAREGGAGTLDYLYSGMGSGKRKLFGLEFHKVGETWTAYTGSDAGKVPFTKMFMRKNTFLGKTIGIKEILTQ